MIFAMLASEAKLNLYLLGPPRFQHEQKDISLPYQKAEALLAYLAVTGRRHSREKLATLLWENSDERRARNNLRSALCALRKNLSPDILLTEQHFVSIRSEAVWTDVAHLRSVTKAVTDMQACASIYAAPATRTGFSMTST